jgi:hypothetical protein
MCNADGNCPESPGIVANKGYMTKSLNNLNVEKGRNGYGRMLFRGKQQAIQGLSA